jgi:hypothetical protein
MERGDDCGHDQEDDNDDDDGHDSVVGREKVKAGGGVTRLRLSQCPLLKANR